MGLFKKVADAQFANVIEWQGFSDDMLFYKWDNDEIKKGSRLILRPGQSAIFLYNGVVEGKFDDEGSFDIESDIIPFLSTLKGFKFGLNSGIRAEVLFVNTKQVLSKWGTQQPIMLQADGMPGGLPIRANGTFTVQLGDYMNIVNNISGLPVRFTVENIRERLMDSIEPAMMSAIASEGKDIFNIQANGREISAHVIEELSPELETLGFKLVNFTIRQVSYPKEVQERVNQNAGINMFNDTNKLQQVAMADGLAKGNNTGNDIMGAMMGMTMAQNMMNNQKNATENTTGNAGGTAAGNVPKFCPNCGQATNGANFCGNCGNKLV